MAPIGGPERRKEGPHARAGRIGRGMEEPSLAVVIATRDRPLRLAALLGDLSEGAYRPRTITLVDDSPRPSDWSKSFPTLPLRTLRPSRRTFISAAKNLVPLPPALGPGRPGIRRSGERAGAPLPPAHDRRRGDTPGPPPLPADGQPRPRIRRRALRPDAGVAGSMGGFERGWGPAARVARRKGVGKVLRTPGTRCCPLATIWKDLSRGGCRFSILAGLFEGRTGRVRNAPSSGVPPAYRARCVSGSGRTMRGSSPSIAGGRRATALARAA